MGYEWFKLNSKGWLEGSIRVTMTSEQRGVWIDLLSLANESRLRDGTLRYAENLPMDRAWIASKLQISLDLLNTTIEVCRHDKNRDGDRHRIEIWEDGTIELTNFAQYQAVPPEKSRPREDARARELRERRTVRQLAKQYPDEAQDSLGVDDAEKS